MGWRILGNLMVFLVHQRSPTEYSGMGGGLNKIYAN